MNVVKRYAEYLKDNPKGYWFKAKLFGWGWTPAKWQGWVAIILYILTLLLIVLSLGNGEGSEKLENSWPHLLAVIILTVIMLAICYKKGEKPSWNWGFPKEK